MALVELERYANSFEAGMARARVEAEDIRCFLFDLEMSPWGFSDGMMIRLMVDEEDLGAGRAILGGR